MIPASSDDADSGTGCAVATVVVFLVVVALLTWLVVLLVPRNRGGAAGTSHVQWCSTQVELFELLGKGKPVLIAFVSSRCGHCEKMKSAYNAAAAELDIAVAAVDVSVGEWGDALRQAGDVAGVPHIMYAESGDLSRARVYSGDRSKSSFLRFVRV